MQKAIGVNLDVRMGLKLTGETAVTLRAGCSANEKPCVIIIEHHPNDSRTQISKDQKNVQSLTQRMGTGGGNVPLIMVKEKK